jgi:hypothetical protein
MRASRVYVENRLAPNFSTARPCAHNVASFPSRYHDLESRSSRVGEHTDRALQKGFGFHELCVFCDPYKCDARSDIPPVSISGAKTSHVTFHRTYLTCTTFEKGPGFPSTEIPRMVYDVARLVPLRGYRAPPASTLSRTRVAT